MMAESVHFRIFFSKKIYLPKSFILTKSAAETNHEKILTAEIANFSKILDRCIWGYVVSLLNASQIAIVCGLGGLCALLDFEVPAARRANSKCI